MTTLRQYDARWAVFGKFPLCCTVQVLTYYYNIFIGGGGGVYYTELHYFALHFWLFFVYGVMQCSQTSYTKKTKNV